MRSIRSCRSAAVNFQLNGLAVWLYRSMKVSRVRDSWSRLSKSLGVTTFFWMTEKKISIWFSQEACRGVWIMIAFGCAWASRVTAAWPRWSEPLSTMTNTRGAFLYSGRVMTWPARSMNGAIPVVTGGGAQHRAGGYVQSGEQREGALALVFVLVADRPA